MKYFIIYKITNKINNKFYIGAHSTYNLNDGYMGSGVAINDAIKKYGIENFSKEIISQFKTEAEMYEFESKVVEVSENTYNLILGGNGGWSYARTCITKDSIKKRMLTMSTDEFVAATLDKRILQSNRMKIQNPMFDCKVANKSGDSRKGKLFTDEHRENISKSCSGIKHKYPTERSSKNYKSSEIVICPHCSITGKERGMSRWHFDNCKSKA